MIQLHSDSLVFEVSGGDKIPCSVEKLTIEILADSLDHIDPQVIQQAAAAVLHYFKDDLGRDNVTVGEFTTALERVLQGLGFQVEGSTITKPSEEAVAEVDLAHLAASHGTGLELDFYNSLRQSLREALVTTPRVVRFSGLRPCAKRLARVRRWCPKCTQVSDEIVGFLRACWGAEAQARQTALLVN